MPQLETSDELFAAWLRALEARHLRDLRPAELTRALRALSSIYVERRAGLRAGRALNGAGKRAAFALFYAPLHFLIVRAIVRLLDAASDSLDTIIDLGCGTGTAGAAWSLEAGSRPRVLGIDRHPWAVREAVWNYQTLGIRGRAVCGDLGGALAGGARAIVAAFAINELADRDREVALNALLRSADRGASVLVVEPIARSIAPWWPEWSRQFLARRGARVDEWRIPVQLPALLERLDRAADLDHSVLTGRSLFISRLSPATDLAS